MLHYDVKRSLFFKVLLGWVYLSFFCVQLHLKYTVAFDAVSRSGNHSVIKKQETADASLQKTCVIVNVKLNKRYQPESLYMAPRCPVPDLQLPAVTFSFREYTIPDVPGASLFQISLRGPPAC